MLDTQSALAALSLPEAAARAVAHSPEVRVKMHQFLGAGADLALARAGFLPEVEVALDHVNRQTLSRQDSDTAGNASPHKTTRRTWSLSLTQNLFNGFQTIYATQQQGHAQSAHYFQLLDVSEQQALEAGRAFLDVIRQRDHVAAARVNHESHVHIYQKIRHKVRPESGVAVGAGVDLEQAGGRLARAEANLLTAQANLADVSARYVRIVGELPPTDLTRYRRAPPVSASSLDATPAARAARASVSAARQSVSARRGAFLPRFDARLRHEWGQLPSGQHGRERSRSNLFELSAALNLSRGGADKARLQRAAEDLNAAVATQDKVCREALQHLQMAQNEQDQLTRKIDFLRQHALASEKVRDAYWDQFEISKRSLLDVLDSEDELFLSRSALIDGEADLALADLRLQAASGTLLNTLGITPALPAPPPLASDAQDVGCEGRIASLVHADNHDK